ncbi:flagellar protein FlaG [Porticoccus sp.]
MADITSSLLSGLNSVISASTPVDRTAATSGRQELSVNGNVLPEEGKSQPSEVEIVQAVTEIADYIQRISRELQFRVDEHSGSTVITVLDSQTDEIVRQIPAEEAVAMARYIEEVRSGMSKGLLLKGSE